jgi:acyl-CoA thioester hydrolase
VRSEESPDPPQHPFVIARLVLEFRAEMHWPGTVEIGTRVERVGRSSATLAQVLFVHEACVATAESVAAMMDMTTRRSALLPGETAEALRAMGWANSGGVPAATAVNVLHR